MRWLADENLARLIVEWLRDSGHDVLYTAEALASRLDDDLLAGAQRESRFVTQTTRTSASWCFTVASTATEFCFCAFALAPSHSGWRDCNPYGVRSNGTSPAVW